MTESAKFHFKSESLPSKGKFNRKVMIALAAVGALAVAYLYFQYLHHLTHPRVAAGHAAPAVPVAGKSKLPVVAPQSAAPQPTNTDNQAPAAPAPVSLGESLMAVIAPSAKGETIQPEMQPLKNMVQPQAVPAARQPLPLQAVRHQTAQSTEDQKRLQVAQAGFDKIMDLVGDNRDIFGFAPNDKLDEARLGDPIPVYTVTAADRKSYQAGQPLKPILQATNEWIFPVTLNNRVRFMMPVKRVDGEYVAETSSRSLAIAYARILDRWPVTEGYHPQLVVNANIADYYFTIPELPDQNLTATSEMFEFHPKLSPAPVILASWR